MITQKIHLIIFIMFPLIAIGQDTLQATYFLGDIPTNYDVYSDACNGPSTTLSITLPQGDAFQVTGAKVLYDMTALGDGLMEHQRSKVKCSNTGLEEPEVMGVGASPGTMAYERDITVANGVYPGNTELVFEMWARRTVEAIPGCNTDVNRVNAATWTVIIYFGEASVSDVIMKQSGRLGIGTLVPQSLLHVYSDGDEGDLILEDASPFISLNSLSGGTSGINFQDNGALTASITYEGNALVMNAASSPGSHLVVRDNGYIGVNTITPQSRLHIVGQVNEGDLRLDDEYPFVFLNTTNSQNAGIAFMDNGSLEGFILREGASNNIRISTSSPSQPDLVVASNGNVGIGTSSPTVPLYVVDTMSISGLELANLGSSNLGLDGDVVPYGGSSLGFDLGNNISSEHWDDVVASEFITFSDAGAKNDIVLINSGLEQILALRPVEYRYKESITPDDRLRFGLIAQEVEDVLPNVVVTEDVDIDPKTGLVQRQSTDLKAINYIDIIPVLVRSIQEQQEYIQTLEERILKLEEE